MAATMLFPDGVVFDISGDAQLVATHGDLIVYRGDPTTTTTTTTSSGGA